MTLATIFPSKLNSTTKVWLPCSCAPKQIIEKHLTQEVVLELCHQWIQTYLYCTERETRLEMRYLPTNLPTENWTKSVSKIIIDGITDWNNPLVRNKSVIKKIEYYRQKNNSSVKIKNTSVIIVLESVTDIIKPTNY